MVNFSPQVNNFLRNTGVDSELEIAIVPKSDSCGRPGEFLFFRYKLGKGENSRRERIFLITEPVTKCSKTGNLLLTGFRLPDRGNYTPESLTNLYKNKELPRENYRTYIMSNIYGPLRKITLKQKDVENERRRLLS